MSKRNSAFRKKAFFLRPNIFCLLVVVFVLFGISKTTHAQIIINEILYDAGENTSGSTSDSGREWVELYNTGSSSIDLSEWKFFENGTNHGLSSYQGGSSIQAGSYAIIADNPEKFLLDYPNVSVPIFDSSFSLSNSGEILSLKDANLVTQDSITYTPQGDANSGYSLQLINSAWQLGLPTPGSANTATTGNQNNALESNNQENEDTSISNADESAKTTIVQSNKTRATFVFEAPALTHVPVEFETHVTGSDGRPLSHGDFFWNLGDGTIIEKNNLRQESFLHTYTYPGTYIATFEYRRSAYQDEPTIRIQKTITVTEPVIIIEKLHSDGAIEIRNKGNQQINLEGWHIQHNELIFRFPRATYLMPHSTLILSSAATHFSHESNPIELLTPNGTGVATYDESAKEMKEEIQTPRVQEKNIYVSEPQTVIIPEPANTLVQESRNQIQNTASVIFADEATDGVHSSSRGNLWWIAFVITLVLAAIGFFLIQNKTAREQAAKREDELDLDDIEILE